MNPFAPGDKVITKHKGAEVEATVRLVWNDEVQVRTQPDNVLRWRTVKTVRPAAVSAQTVDASVPPRAPTPDEIPAPAPVVETQPAPQEVQEPTQAGATTQPATNVVPCGATEVQPNAKGNRKARRRR